MNICDALSIKLELSFLAALMAVAGIMLCMSPADAGSPDGRRGKYVEFTAPQEWKLEIAGHHHGRYDRRNLYCMYHLAAVSEPGDHATLTTEVTIPADWEPPFGLEFFCSDNYQVDPGRLPNEGWMSCHAYPGHRHKQILVDGEIVWQSDVSDVGVGGVYGVDLTEHVRPGVPLSLALRVTDRFGTAVALEGEHFHAGGFEPKENPRAFPTQVYWGDLLLTERFEDTRMRLSRESPSAQRLRRLAAEGLVPPGPRTQAQAPAKLSVEAPGGAPAGWPLSCGLPLPEGAVRNVEQLQLHDGEGQDLKAQFAPLSHWQDGTVRWASASLPVPPDTQAGETWSLNWRPEDDAGAPGGGVGVNQVGDDLIVGNGLISVSVPGGGAHAIGGVESVQGGILAGPMEAVVEEETDNGEVVRYQASWDERRVLVAGPRLATVELRGELRAPEGALGRCVFRFSVADGSPLLRASLRIFNDTERHLRVSRIALEQGVPAGATRGMEATLEQPAGWFAVDGSGATTFAAIRWAAEMPTKAVRMEGDVLNLGLFVGTDAIAHYRPRMGEARRIELVLGYFAGQPDDARLAAIAAATQRPPRLWDSRWTADTGALGHAATRLNGAYERLGENRTRRYGEMLREDVQMAEYDMRNFGDRRYGNTSWSNNYYDASRGFIAEYLMTANPNAFDRVEEQVLHQVDVDQCHWHTNPALVGGLWAYAGDDHSNAGYHWAPLQRAAAGFAYYWRMTGDPDALEALQSIADYALSRNTGYVSVRDHGGILTAQVWAYDETGDERYLHGARETMADIHTRMSRRRGPYLEPNGNYSFLLSVPWMASEMADAFYRLWQLSGDVEAAVTALGLAEAMMQENGTWGLPGELGGYSGNPYFALNSNYHIIVAPVLGYGYEMTQDPEFLLWARACFERTLDEDTVDAITNNYWLAPRLLYLLEQYGHVETQTPQTPDVRVPANFGWPPDLD